KDIAFYNPGTDTLIIRQNFTSFADTDFTYKPLMGLDTIIPPEVTRYATMCITPRQRGTRLARIRVLTNIPHTFNIDPQSPGGFQDTSSFAVNVSATGVSFGRLVLTGPLTVDTVAVGTEDCRDYTLTNVGEGDVNVTGATIFTGDAAD